MQMIQPQPPACISVAFFIDDTYLSRSLYPEKIGQWVGFVDGSKPHITYHLFGRKDGYKPVRLGNGTWYWEADR